MWLLQPELYCACGVGDGTSQAATLSLPACCLPAACLLPACCLPALGACTGCLQAFSPCELFARIRGRTLWFMGDSQTWHFFYSAECFLREFAPSLRRT